MGILTINHMCSHLQNASRARLGLTSVPNNKYNLNLALALHRAGFIASVTRAGPTPPPPEILTKFEDDEPVTTANVATRRLWLGLKYWDDKPVLRRLQAVSRPSRTVWADLDQLGRVSRGFEAGHLKGLNLGESMFVSTDRGVLEIREALAKKVGGVVLCRVS
ncbi:ribosomal protein S8 [Echria macrotheca]|uniref:Ribosomal protein S8 n=1 Tax=Echria macrotheca TaxID=438768 RepID=A0AAJ0BFK3_9PEZI|nr:ribosomal protein S8 [Echria macrotheca]